MLASYVQKRLVVPVEPVLDSLQRLDVRFGPEDADVPKDILLGLLFDLLREAVEL